MKISVPSAFDCVWIFYLCPQLKCQISSLISVTGNFPEQVTQCPTCTRHSIKVADREVTFRNKIKKATGGGTQWFSLKGSENRPQLSLFKGEAHCTDEAQRGPMSCLQTLKSEPSQDHFLTAFLPYIHLIINELQGRS